MSDEQRIRDVYRTYDAEGRSRLWDPANRGYARLSAERDAALTDLLGQALAGSAIAGRPRLLDVGCGDGSLLETVSRRWPGVAAAGIDLLSDRVETARSRVPGADVRVGSADALPFADDGFDVAAAVTVFSSIPSPDMEAAVAREIWRVLRPGGCLIWYDLRYDNPSNRQVHGLSTSRVQELFPRWEVELRSFTLAPPVARRLGPLTPFAYPLLHAIPPLRSHLIGRLQCPK